MHLRNLSRRCLAILLCLSLVGCAARLPSLDLHSQLHQQTIALLPGQARLPVDLGLYARSRPAGAAKGAMEGIVQGFGNLNFGSCQGELCGVVLLIYLATVVVVGGTVGAIVGATEGTPADESKNIESTINQTLADFPLHLDLGRKVLAQAANVPGLTLELTELPAGPGATREEEYRQLRNRGFDSALEVQVEEIGFVGGSGKNPELALHLRALARIVDLKDQSPTYDRDFELTGTARPFSSWTSMGEEPIRRALEDHLQRLSESIVDGLFLQADLPISSNSWGFPGTKRYGCCWLCPVSPPNDYSFWKKALQYTWVRSLTPTLEWESFPDREQADRLRDRGDYEIIDVRYDLKIWEMIGGQRGRLVYERKGLEDSSHTLESPLRPRWSYFWSFRACFKTRGGAVCTPWAFSLIPSRDFGNCEREAIPDWNYYRFRTP